MMLPTQLWRREGRLLIIAATILIIAHAAATVGHLLVQEISPAPGWAQPLLLILSSAMGVVLMTAPALLVVGLLLLRWAALEEETDGDKDRVSVQDDEGLRDA